MYKEFYTSNIPQNNANIFGKIDTEEFVNLTKLIDPYEYRDRMFNRPNYFRNGTQALNTLLLYTTGNEFVQFDETVKFLEWLPKKNTYVKLADDPIIKSRSVETLDNVLTFYFLAATGR